MRDGHLPQLPIFSVESELCSTIAAAFSTLTKDVN